MSCHLQEALTPQAPCEEDRDGGSESADRPGEGWRLPARWGFSPQLGIKCKGDHTVRCPASLVPFGNESRWRNCRARKPGWDTDQPVVGSTSKASHSLQVLTQALWKSSFAKSHPSQLNNCTAGEISHGVISKMTGKYVSNSRIISIPLSEHMSSLQGTGEGGNASVWPHWTVAQRSFRNLYFFLSQESQVILFFN